MKTKKRASGSQDATKRHAPGMDSPLSGFVETYLVMSRSNDDGTTTFVALVSNGRASGPVFVDLSYEERRAARVEDFLRDLANGGIYLCSAEECSSRPDVVARMRADMVRHLAEVTAWANGEVEV